MGALWNIIIVTFGLLSGLVTAIPFDMDSVKDGIQMGAMAGIGMAMDLAEKAKIEGNMEKKVNVLGVVEFEEKVGGGAGLMGNNNDDDSEEDRRRRKRRSLGDDIDINKYLSRSKRSPCGGRNRARQTTPAPAAGGTGGAGGGAAGGGGGGGGAAGEAGGAGGDGGTTPDLRRRRKRSPDDDDLNNDVIPNQGHVSQTFQEIGEKIRQMMKSMMDTVVRVLENVKNSFANGQNNTNDM